jgi:hypothetical protein
MSELIAPKTIQLFGILEKALNYIRLIESTETTPKIRYINAEPLFNQVNQLESIGFIEGILIDELEYLIGKDELRFKNIKRKYDKVLKYKLSQAFKEKILKSPIDYDMIQYRDEKTGEIYTGYSNPNLTEEILHKYYNYWIENSIDKIIKFQEMLEKLIDDYESEYFPTENAIQKFNTNLTDEQRVALCDEIISSGGYYIEKLENGKTPPIKVFSDINEKHRTTLNYLLGGDKPEEITPIRYAVNSNVFLLLKYITDVDGTGINKDNKVVPNFMRTKICPKILRDKDGKKFDKIKQ